MTIDEHIIANQVLREVNELLESQTIKGLAKYGVTVNPDDYSTVEWIDHARQELIDCLIYLTCLKAKLEVLNRDSSIKTKTTSTESTDSNSG